MTGILWGFTATSVTLSFDLPGAIPVFLPRLFTIINVWKVCISDGEFVTAFYSFQWWEKCLRLLRETCVRGERTVCVFMKQNLIDPFAGTDCAGTHLMLLELTVW